MEKYVVAGLADLADGAYGQTTYDFGKTEQSIDLLESIMHAQNNENSNAIMAQVEAPVPQATLNQGTSQSKAAKRERDKAYREREKKRKIEMKGNVEALTQENRALTDENRALKAENTRLNQALKSNANEMDQLKYDLNQLMPKQKSQDLLVNILLEKLAGSDLSLRDGEIQKLKIEIDLLRRLKCMDNPSSQLVEEFVKLKNELVEVEYEKRELKLQLGAVCEKFIAENSFP